VERPILHVRKPMLYPTELRAQLVYTKNI